MCSGARSVSSAAVLARVGVAPDVRSLTSELGATGPASLAHVRS